MFKTVEEVRYTNDQKDTLYVLFTDDDGTTQEMYVEPNGAEHKELESLGITEDGIVESTGMFKQQTQRELADVARMAAADVYADEIERLKQERDQLKLGVVASNAMFKKQTHESMERYVIQKNLEDKSKTRLPALNKYVKDNITQEKVEVAIPNLISVIQALNENEDAIDLVKGESKIKAKTLIEALYKTLK
tara:strand:+ start:2956 stop:3531 length:576 start_codon:yes stop_codon:yes gene_type:complete